MLPVRGLIALSSLVPPLLLGAIIDEALGAGNLNRIWLIAAGFPVVFLLESGLMAAETALRLRVTNTLVVRRRIRTFRAFLHLPPTEVSKHAPGDLLKRLDDDAAALGLSLEYRVERIFQWVVVIGGGAACVWISWHLAAVGAALAAGMWLASRAIARGAARRIKELDRRQSIYFAWLHESLEHWREIRALAAEAQQGERMHSYMTWIKPYRNYTHTFWTLNSMLGHLERQFVTSSAIYFVGGLLIFAGLMTLGSLITFVRFFKRVVDGVVRIGQLYNDLATLDPMLERVYEVDFWPRSVRSGPVSGNPDMPPVIQCDEVSFRYQQAQILDSVSGEIGPGSIIGIVGETGSGKSTLIRVLTARLAAERGRVSLGGTDVQTLGPMHVARCIAVAGQDSVLFNVSIRENLQLAKPRATDDELFAACGVAQIASFIQQLPKQLDTVIGERGLRLSSGQRQRLVIARAVLLDRPVLVLDEATSQLDEPSERRLHRALFTRFSDRTIVIVAHRITALEHVERCMVIDNGTIESTGTHAELLQISPTYRELFRSSTQRLANSLSRLSRDGDPPDFD